MMMRSLRFASLALALALFVSCAPRPAPAPPPPQVAPPPAPTPAPPPPPPPAAWEDAALSASDWSYRDEGGASSAAFGSPGRDDLVVRCEPGRTITLRREGATAGSSLVVRTTFGDRTVPALLAAASPTALSASFAASDPLLDSLVFSRGRFAVEAAGVPNLIVPAWPEPARVIEDCRG